MSEKNTVLSQQISSSDLSATTSQQHVLLMFCCVCLMSCLPFLRSFRGGRLCVGCKDSSSISWVTASLWGLGTSRFDIPQSPSAPSCPGEAWNSIILQRSGGGQTRGVWVPYVFVLPVRKQTNKKRLEKDELQGDFSIAPQQEELITQSPPSCWCDYSIQLVKHTEWHFALDIWKSSA